MIQQAQTGISRRRWLAAGLLLLPLLMRPGVAAEATPSSLPTLVMVSTEDTARSQGNWLKLIYTEALRRLGYQLEYRTYPAKRASALADQGVVDGELHRVAMYGPAHPNLVRVPTSHYSGTFAAYGMAPLKLADGWSALSADGLRVECRAGITHCELMVSQVVPATRLSSAYTVTLGLRKLQRHRTDVFVDVDRVIDMALAEPEFQNSGIHKLATMDVVEAFSYLHKRHSDLVPKLAQILADMKREGLIDRYRQQPAAPARTVSGNLAP